MKTTATQANQSYTQSQQSTTPRSNHSRRTWLKLAEFSLYTIAGVLAFFSATPWIEVGHAIGSEIAATRLYDALVAIPFLGLLFMLLRWILINALGAGLWAIVNIIQIAPTLLAVPPIYAAIVEWLKSQKQPDSDNPQIAKYQRKISQWLLNVFKEVGQWSAVAYVVELVVNLAYFAPYRGGWSAFLKDAPLWSADKILYVQFGLMVASVCACEVIVRFCLAVWRIFRAVK